jgi:CRP-like cAMP-binding protein
MLAYPRFALRLIEAISHRMVEAERQLEARASIAKPRPMR